MRGTAGRTLLLLVLGLTLHGCGPTTRVTLEQVNEELRALDPQQQMEYLRGKTSVDRLGDAAVLEGTEPVVLSWYSLVVGLAGTGCSEVPDLPPGTLGPDTTLRNELLKSLYRSQVPGSPSKILHSKDSAPVLVTAVVPPLVRPNQRLDLVVQALGQTRSLRGGVLMTTPLRRAVDRPGRGRFYGDTWAYGEGRVTLSSGRLAFGEVVPVSETVGYVPAGAASTVTGFLALRLRKPDAYAAALVTLAINDRFPNTAVLPSLASVETVRIIVPEYYRAEWQRFSRVLMEIRCRPPRGRMLRSYINRLARQMEGNDPALAQQAAYKLEALGPEAVPALEGVLRSPRRGARLLAACTLAAMREPVGITPLMEFVQNGTDKERRLAARYLNFYTQHNVRQFQKKLLADSDPEVRYRALVGLETTQEDGPYTTHEEARGEDFTITLVRCAGEPALVVKGRNPRRLVFFGPDLNLRPPFRVEHLKELLIEAQDHTAVIHYQVYGQPNVLPLRSLRVVDLVRALDHIKVTINDIMDLIFKLSRADAIDGEVLFLDE